MRVLGAVSLAVGIALGVAVAPPAAANQNDYLAQVQIRHPNLSSEVLLNEGYKVCRYVSAGRPSSEAIPMVVQDLGISVAAATDVGSAAIEQLDC